MSEWILVDNKVQEIADEPWSLYWREFKSDTDEFRAFLLDPKPILMREIRGISSDYKVTSEVLNHEISLRYQAVCTICIVMPDEQRVKVLFYKHIPVASE